MVNTGIDILHIQTFEKKMKQYSIKKLLRIFTPLEIKQAEKRSDFYLYLASSFSFKESFFKAVELDRLYYQEIEILRKNHKPIICFYGKTKDFVLQKGYQFSLSMSHHKEYLVTNVISYQKRDV